MDKDFVKKYGKYITTGDKVLETINEYKTLSISPAVDLALGGGIKEGSWVMLSGPPKSGKSTLTMQAIANAMKENRKIMYLNVEGRLKPMNFEIPGLDPSKMEVVQSEGEPLPAETYLDIGRKFISAEENVGGLLVIDSISSLIPQRDLDEDISGMTRPGLPKILSDFTKKLGQIVPNQRAFIFMITHKITNTSGYGKHMMADGGVKIQYQADTRMEIKSSVPWEIGTGDNKEAIGLKVTWDILCSSMGAPFKTCENWLRFGRGVDKIQEIILIGTELGLISVAGSWQYLDFLNEGKALDDRIKCQGQEKVYNYFIEHPDAYDKLEKTVKEMLA